MLAALAHEFSHQVAARSLSTCHVYVVRGEDELPEIYRAVNPRINSRLACQCVVQAEGNDLVILVLVAAGLRLAPHRQLPQDFLGHYHTQRSPE